MRMSKFEVVTYLSRKQIKRSRIVHGCEVRVSKLLIVQLRNQITVIPMPHSRIFTIKVTLPGALICTLLRARSNRGA